MGLLDKLKRKIETTLSESRLEEELLYKHVLEEMDAGIIRDGLFAKALANSSGDENKARSLYMKYRVRSVQDSLDGESYLEYTEKLQLNQIQQRLLAPKKKLTKSELKSKIEELFTERQKIEKKLKKATKNSKPSKKELKLNKMKLIIESQKIERELKKRR
jgi:septal ring factor EnvC (AmiA/AmiB activator)